MDSVFHPMILKPISEDHTKEILIEMCSRVGVLYSKEFFVKENWYEQYTWTEKEQEEFRKWLGDFLTKHKYTTKGKYRGQPHGYYEAGKFIFIFGWKCTYD